MEAQALQPQRRRQNISRQCKHPFIANKSCIYLLNPNYSACRTHGQALIQTLLMIRERGHDLLQMLCHLFFRSAFYLGKHVSEHLCQYFTLSRNLSVT